MSKASGQVQLSDSGYGVPGLVVTAYDARPGSLATKGGVVSADDVKEGGSRLASGITGVGGHFTIPYEPRAIHGADCERGPDLVLLISGAEGDCATPQRCRPEIVTCVRRNASTTETFLIHIDAARLREAGIRVEVPKTAEETAADRRREVERRTRAKAEAKAAADKATREALEARRQVALKAEASFETFLSAQSGVSPQMRSNPNSGFVPRGASVDAATAKSIRSGIERRVNRATREGTVALSDKQAARLKDADGNFRERMPAAVLDKIISPGDGLLHDPSPTRAVWSQIICGRGVGRYDCLKHVAGDPPAGQGVDDEQPDECGDASPPPGGNGVNGNRVASADVPELIAKLMEHLTPPEAGVVFGVGTGQRATLSDVCHDVKGLQFHGGPADVPAFHDFHHCQIALEHVWLELFDNKVFQEEMSLFEEFVELGVEPNEYVTATPCGPIVTGVTCTSPTNKVGGQPAAGASSAVTTVPQVVFDHFDADADEWAKLTAAEVELLTHASQAIQQLEVEKKNQFDWMKDRALYCIRDEDETLDDDYAGNETQARNQIGLFDEEILAHRRNGEQIIREAIVRSDEPVTFDQFHPLLESLCESMKEPYRFSVYAADHQQRSVNFGLVTTYRQQWVPGSYQAGKLVKTIPLAPKEVRRYSRKTSHKQSRAEKEVDKNLHSRRTESAETSRVETEIVRKALNKTNFQMNAKGSIHGTIGVVGAEASASTGFDKSAETQSQEVKKEFREAVFKAAEEYKSERETVIDTSVTEESEATDSGEISNPNDEITVTYLFYELQRRYRVSEQLHRITPVVLVAQEFPSPDCITEAWIVAHDWILRRVILDDSFVPAMNYLASKVVGDEHALQEMFKNVEQQRRLMDEIKEEVVAIRGQSGQRYAALQTSMTQRAEVVAADEQDEGFFDITPGLLFGGSDPSPAAAQVREDAARDAYERAARQEKELQARLEREVTALNALTEQYTKALSDHLNRRTQISRLRVHLKQNIMYYMQAIWSHEPPDQRFFRLHDVQVPRMTGKMTYSLKADPDAVPEPPTWKTPLKLTAHCGLDDDDIEYDSLVEVADLDNLLGFKGNYMMFPLKKGNVLTEFMSVPYFSASMGLWDPDPLGNWTLEEFAKYVCCLYKNSTKKEFEKMMPGLQQVYARLMAAPAADGEEIIVPTDSLFIEALPGTHPILEDFKLVHRAVDVKKAQAEVRAMELENVRFVARLGAGEREDPTIEKKVVIEGGNVVLTPEE